MRKWSWQVSNIPIGRGCRVSADVQADPVAHRLAACAARAGLTQAVVPAGKLTLGGMPLDDGKHSHQRHETAVVVDHGGKRSTLQSRIGLDIAVKSPNGYSDAQNQRSSGECRFGASIVGCVLVRGGRATGIDGVCYSQRVKP